MYTLNEYVLYIFDKQKNKSIYVELLSENSRISVETEFYLVDGEDPLIKARVQLEPFNSREDGGCGTIYVHPDKGEITVRSIYEAVGEFLGGSFL